MKSVAPTASRQRSASVQRLLVLIQHRGFLWILLSLPAIPLLADFYFDQRYYAEMMYESGVISVQLLVATLAITPLMVIFRNRGRFFSALRWAQLRRRYLGVACFGYALIHLLVYLRRYPEISDILWHMQDLKIIIGWSGFIVLLALALTSNDRSVQTLGAKWKALHRWIYIGTAMIFLHWGLFGFFIDHLFLWLLPIALLQLIRVYLQSQPKA